MILCQQAANLVFSTLHFALSAIFRKMHSAQILTYTNTSDKGVPQFVNLYRLQKDSSTMSELSFQKENSIHFISAITRLKPHPAQSPYKNKIQTAVLILGTHSICLQPACVCFLLPRFQIPVSKNWFSLLETKLFLALIRLIQILVPPLLSSVSL